MTRKCKVANCTKDAYRRLYMCWPHYYRHRRYGNATEGLHQKGIAQEFVIADILRAQGRTVEKCPYQHPFDLLVDRLRIEVKSATERFESRCGFWKFIISRVGKLPEPCDYYIFCLLEQGEKPMYLLFKAPLGVHTFTISSRQLANGQYVQASDDFVSFSRGELIDAASK